MGAKSFFGRVRKRLRKLCCCSSVKTADSVVTLSKISEDSSCRGSRLYFEELFHLIKHGNISQTEVPESIYLGVQCTSMAISALVKSETLDFHLWNSSDIDYCLSSGDSIHRFFRDELVLSTEVDNKVALEDIPSVTPVFLDNAHYLVTVCDRAYGLVWPADCCSVVNATSGPPVLSEYLNECFSHDWVVVITILCYSLAIRKVAGQVWLFDSHARDYRGRIASDGDGTACIIPFTTTQALEAYLIHTYELKNDGYTNQFTSLALALDQTDRNSYEMVALDINPQFHEMVRAMNDEEIDDENAEISYQVVGEQDDGVSVSDVGKVGSFDVVDDNGKCDGMMVEDLDRIDNNGVDGDIDDDGDKDQDDELKDNGVEEKDSNDDTPGSDDNDAYSSDFEDVSEEENDRDEEGVG